MVSRTFTGTAGRQVMSLTQLRYVLNLQIRQAVPLKAEIKADRFTSLVPKASVIHELDKGRSTVVMVNDKLYIRAVALCGVRPSPLNIHLLTYWDAFYWVTSNMRFCDVVIGKYGDRHECDACSRMDG